MPRMPIVSTLNANSVGILNVIRDNASPDYRQAVPAAVETTESIRQIGTIILGFEPRKNEFVNALVNRIAMTLVTSKMYSSQLAIFKKGYIELGETIEEIFVALAEPHQFDPETAETEVFKREIPNVKSMFHAMNYQKFYKATVSNDQLRQAFLSWDGVVDLVTRIVEQLYSAMNYDEYLMTKYIVARLALDGSMPTVKIDDFTVSANSDKVVTTVKEISNNMRFMRSDYNIANVENFSSIENQYLLATSKFSANVDVNSLAKAYNLTYAEFLGKQILVDSFSFTSGELKRLSKLLEADPDYTEFSSNDLNELATIGAVMLDKDFFMIFDNLQESTSIYNAQGLSYNEFLHAWKTFSASPFANAVLLTTQDSSVTAVTISPAGPVASVEDHIQFTASVSGTGFYNKAVKWSVTGNNKPSTKIGEDTGLLIIGADETASRITVKATSTYDSTKSDATEVTIS